MKNDQKSLLSQASLLCDLLVHHGECIFIFNGILIKIRENATLKNYYNWQMYEEDSNECYNPIRYGFDGGSPFNVVDKVIHIIAEGKHHEH